MSTKYGRSRLWQHNNATRVTDQAVTNLEGFKSNAVNYKLALWDPGTNGVRYLKTLLYDLAGRMSEKNWEQLCRIENRDIGDPLTVRRGGQPVCMDYLQAVHELDFIEQHVSLDDAHVLEIGAGYGRTCHAVMSNHHVSRYLIVDLENSLTLAHNYLERVMDADRFSRIEFIPAQDVEYALNDSRFDLCVNVDSFAEMDPETVHAYLGLVDACCDHFYVNNPVGKYLDKSLDGHSQGEEVVRYALSTGPLREVIDIYDDLAVESRSETYVAVYRPGGRWRCVTDEPAIPWGYYRQAFYTRTER